MATTWDPEQYLKFEDERARPFFDLIARIPNQSPSTVVDLGSGPGNMTATLAERWPQARIVGIDNSSEMVERAQAHAVPGRLEFVLQDLRDWKPHEPVDVILSAATLHWVPGHLELISSFLTALAPGGIFAFQVPGNFRQASHTLLEELAMSDRWRDLLGGAVAEIPRSREPSEYLAALLQWGARVDVWETTYLHVLQGPDAVLHWISGTGMRPVLAALERSPNPGDKEEFLAIYASLLRAAYPRDSHDRTIFPFRRIFGVALV